MKSRKTTRRTTTDLQDFKNRVRGALGAYRDAKSPMRKQPGQSHDDFYSRRLKRILYDSRLMDIDPAEAIGWFCSQVENRLEVINNVLTTYDQLSAAVPVPKIRFDAEIAWTTCRLAASASLLSQFRAEVQSLDEMLWSENMSKTSHKLRGIEQTFGKSLWSIETRLAMENRFGGLESLKELTRAITSEADPMTSFISYYVSERNEIAVIPSRFRAQDDRRIRKGRTG